MKKIILLIIALIFLSGCGIYNLNNFILPNDIEFMQIVESLESPQKISDYMVENFTYERHGLYTPSPYILWLEKEGDCNDFATFGMFIANYHGYETYQVRLFGENFCHIIAVYVEDVLSYTSNRGYYYGHDSIKEIVERFPEMKSYKVYNYDNNLIEKEDF